MEKSEARIQSEFHVWLWNSFPKLRRVSFAIPNGGSRGKVEAARLKSQGVVAGIPDYCIAVPAINNDKKEGLGMLIEWFKDFLTGDLPTPPVYGALFIEFKEPGARMNNDHVRNQTMVQSCLREAGNKVILCTSVEQAQQAVLEYFRGTHWLES